MIEICKEKHIKKTRKVTYEVLKDQNLKTKQVKKDVSPSSITCSLSLNKL